MSKALKVIGILFVVLLLAVAGGAAGLLFVVDPNDYKGEIAAAVEEKTGRTLEMGGDIGLTLFPWIALELERVALSDAPGFGDAPFAKVERAELRVKLMPLLEERVEMDTLVLHGLELNLLRNKDGSTNWQDLAERGEGKAEHPKKGEAKKLAALAIGGVDLRDATVRWRDRQGGVAYSLEGVELTSGAITPGAPVDLALKGRFASEAPKVNGDLDFSGRITVDPAAQRLAVDGLKLALNAAGETLPGGRVELSLAAQVAADGKKRSFDATALELSLFGLPLRGEIHGAGEKLTGKLDSGTFDPRPVLAALGAPLPEGATVASASLAAEFDADAAAAKVKGFKFSIGELKGEGELNLNDFAAPRYSGRFQAGFVDLRALLAALGQAVPETADPKAMTKVGVRTTFEGSKSGLNLPKLEFALDESYLQGSVKVSRFDAPSTRFDLKLNQIDVDRYLPPPPPEGAAPPAAATATAPAAGNPLAPLAALDLAGTLTIDQLKVKGMSAQAVSLTLKAKDGVVELKPASAKLYEGTYRGTAILDARGKEPRFHLDKQLQGVRIGTLLHDLTGEEARIDGRGNVVLNLTGAGMEPEAVKRSLDGDVRFAFRDGAVKGVNVVQLLREANARLKGRPAPPAGANQTDFTELTGSLRVDKGIAVNRDFTAKSPLLRINGEGAVDLPQSRLDYGVQVKVVGSLQGQGGAELNELKGITVPLRAKGPFHDLSYKLDVGKAVKEQAKEKVKEKVKDKLGDKLKGIFNR